MSLLEALRQRFLPIARVSKFNGQDYDFGCKIIPFEECEGDNIAYKFVYFWQGLLMTLQMAELDQYLREAKKPFSGRTKDYSIYSLKQGVLPSLVPLSKSFVEKFRKVVEFDSEIDFVCACRGPMLNIYLDKEDPTYIWVKIRNLKEVPVHG